MVVVEENRSEEQSTVETTMNDIEALVDLKSSISFRIKSSISGLFSLPSIAEYLFIFLSIFHRVLRGAFKRIRVELQ